MRYLGIDFGEKRIGLAVSDPGGKIAFPRNILLNSGNSRLGDQLKAFIAEEKISKIVIGLPLDLDQKETKESREARKFVTWLGTITSIPIVFENEMLTSRMADHPGVAAHKIDAASAALILQSFLDKVSA